MEAVKNRDMIELISKLVIQELQKSGVTIEKDYTKVPVSISARHIHLTKEHLEILFGQGYELTKFKDISQPGQYAAKEKVTIIGPKNSIKNVRILGPIRKETQIEVSTTDTRVLGVKPVVRQSGVLNGTPGLTIVGPKGQVTLEKGCIVTERHIHMTPEDAINYKVEDGEVVGVKVDSIRGGILQNVYVRVREDFALDMHIDVDDSNAFGINNGEKLEIIK